MLSDGKIVVYVDSQAKFVVARHDAQQSHADSQSDSCLAKEVVKKESGTSPSDSQAKKEALQALVASIESRKHVDSQAEVIPLYNRAIHKSGDRVRLRDGTIVIVPELDADGVPIPQV